METFAPPDFHHAILRDVTNWKGVNMDILFLTILFVVAFLYASIGHGGASGYLALMALFGIDHLIMRSSALTLNLFVAGVSFIAYYRGGYFRWNILLPFIITSIPMAFLGAKMEIDPRLYKIILGIFLFIAVLRMLILKPNNEVKTRMPNLYLGLVIGASLGFFSGMIGIGGGIILSPILILMRWANVKEAAAVSSLFIFLNSASGLFGVLQSGFNPNPEIFYWIVIAMLGGLLGSYSGSIKFTQLKLQYILALVLVIASFKLFVF
jgi:uncharacterized membrane protein YfcA